MRQPSFTLLDRWGNFIGRLSGVTSAVHTEALDGTDELTITCDDDLTKGERIVWFDNRGDAHEHIVDEPQRTHDEQVAPVTTATCINSISSTWDDYVEDKRPSGNARTALDAIIAGTMWTAGSCDVQGNASHTFYHISVREALTELCDTWGGELETTITVSGAAVTERIVRIRALRGNQASPKRFTWTKDIKKISRKVPSDGPKSRIYGYGKGVETESGGYGRRLEISEANGGIPYVEDTAATAIWGHPDGKGGIAPAVGTFVDEQCDDAATLLAETKAYLDSVKEAKASYTADVIDLEAFGRDWEGVGIGDSVAIIDKEFSPEGIRIKGRVSQIKRDLLANEAQVTFGNLTDAMADMWQSVSQQLSGQSQRSASYDAAAGQSEGWLKQLQNSLNEQFNKAGSYKVETFELGSIWSNVPLDATTGKPQKRVADMWAININGKGFRIADGLTSSGEWAWSTFGTGAGFTADCIRAGVIMGGASYWDLDSGNVLIQGIFQTGSTGDRVLVTPSFKQHEITGSDKINGCGVQFMLPHGVTSPYIASESSTKEEGDVSALVMHGGYVGSGDPGGWVRVGMRRDSNLKPFGKFWAGAYRNYSKGTNDQYAHLDLNSNGDGKSTYARLRAVDAAGSVGIEANITSNMLHLGGILGGWNVGRTTMMLYYWTNLTIKPYQYTEFTATATPAKYGIYKPLATVDHICNDSSYWMVTVSNASSSGWKIWVTTPAERFVTNVDAKWSVTSDGTVKKLTMNTPRSYMFKPASASYYLNSFAVLCLTS